MHARHESGHRSSVEDTTHCTLGGKRLIAIALLTVCSLFAAQTIVANPAQAQGETVEQQIQQLMAQAASGDDFVAGLQNILEGALDLALNPIVLLGLGLTACLLFPDSCGMILVVTISLALMRPLICPLISPLIKIPVICDT